MQNDILFDNIYIGHSEEGAKNFAEETWVIKHEIEKAAEDQESKKYEDKEVCIIVLLFLTSVLLLIVFYDQCYLDYS